MIATRTERIVAGATFARQYQLNDYTGNTDNTYAGRSCTGTDAGRIGAGGAGSSARAAG